MVYTYFRTDYNDMHINFILYYDYYYVMVDAGRYIVFCNLFSQQQLIVFVKTYYKVTTIISNNEHGVILSRNCWCGSIGTAN